MIKSLNDKKEKLQQILRKYDPDFKDENSLLSEK